MGKETAFERGLRIAEETGFLKGQRSARAEFSKWLDERAGRTSEETTEETPQETEPPTPETEADKSADEPTTEPTDMAETKGDEHE